jgi:acyl-CoA synthetase (AMP-forming)/AMP-acid ligase II
VSLWELLEDAARAAPSREAAVGQGERLDYAGLHDRACSAAAALAAAGVGPGGRVAALDANTVDHLALYFAAARLGAVLCPLNLRLAAPELEFVLRDSAARALVVGDGFEELAASLALDARCARLVGGALRAGAVAPPPPAAVDAHAPAQLYYTSGTTGRAKGVVLTHANVRAHAEACVAELDLSADDRWGHFAPMFHLADAWACFAVTLARGAHVLPGAFEAGAALRCIAGERVTATNLVPTMLTRMTASDDAGAHDLSSLRLVLSGGAPITPALVRRVQATFGCEYAQTYGLTETSPFLTLGRLTAAHRRLPAEEQLRRSARTGRPFRGVEVEVVDGAGRPVANDDWAVGEIRARGPSVSPGYWQRPDETAAAFRDGWLYTGDLARVDAEGWLDIVDRSKDVILAGGETVYSTEVEAALAEHSAVLEAAAFALPDEEWGEVVAAAVVLRPGASATAAELTEHCRGLLARYKAPRVVRFLDELPRTGSGKVRKRTLRES